MKLVENQAFHHACWTWIHVWNPVRQAKRGSICCSWSMTEPVSIRSPLDAPKSPSTGCLCSNCASDRSLLASYLFIFSVCVHQHAVYNLLSALQSRFHIFCGRLLLITYKNSSGGPRCYERLLLVVSPAGKWCDTCTGPQGYIKEQAFGVWGTCGSSVYLWSHMNRGNTACVQ